MVSIAKLSLPQQYITDAKTLVDFLDEKGFEIESAFWYIRKDEDGTWVGGEWRLVIVSDDLRSYTTLQNQMHNLDLIIELSDIHLSTENFDGCYMEQQITIK